MKYSSGPATVSTEAKQIANLERLLDEYRGLVSTAVAIPSAKNETVVKLTQEKDQLAKEVNELSQIIKSLKGQLELAESKVLETILLAMYVLKSINFFFFL